MLPRLTEEEDEDECSTLLSMVPGERNSVLYFIVASLSVPRIRMNYSKSDRSPLLLLAALLICFAAAGAELRIGIIGCDTSHVIAFTEMLNDPKAKGHIAGGKVVAAYKGGSKDISSSWSRVEEYSKTLQKKYGVRIYDRIEEMCRNVDAVLLESVDGRPHLEQFKAILRAEPRIVHKGAELLVRRGEALKSAKPVFIDKPMGGSLHDVIEIFRLAERARVPVFSSSALRFGKATQAVRHGSIGKVTYAETYGPCELEPHHPDLFWYGVHGVEALYTILGTGCETVQRAKTKEGKIEVIGNWGGGRQGIFRENKDFHGFARGEKGETAAGSFDGYGPLVAEIIKFFQTGVAPVHPKETIEIFAFMEAADESKIERGAPVNIRDVLKNQR